MEVYIFGAGANGRALAPLLYKYHIQTKAFIDNDKQKCREGAMIDGIACISLKKAAEIAKEEIVLISIYNYEEAEQQLMECGFQFVFSMTFFFRKLYDFIPKRFCADDNKWVKPFNFYESPYPDLTKIHSKEKYIFYGEKSTEGIDFNLTGQLVLLDTFSKIPLLPWKPDGLDGFRYCYNNRFFPKGCAHALYFMLRYLQPKKMVEVGSGFSTAVSLDTNERCLNNKMEIVCIEPNSQRLKSLLKPSDNLHIQEKELQDIPVEFFQKLENNDILFIDSSHVANVNADVNYIFFEILPRLKSGVYIHFHDIFYPFIYPKRWIYEGRAYNEMYVLRAFLMHNSEYEIVLFPDMLVKKESKKAMELFQPDQNPDIPDNHSLWIKKR